MISNQNIAHRLERHKGLIRLTHRLLALAILTVPLEMITVVGNIGSITRLISIGAMSIGICSIVITGWLRKLSLFHILSIIFMLWAILSYQWSINQDSSLTRIFTFIQLIGLTILIWHFADDNDKLSSLLFCYILGAYITIIDTVYQFALVHGAGAQRFSTAHSDPNDLALMLVVAIPIAWYFSTRTGNSLIRLLYQLYIPLTFVTVILTGSRGGAIAMAVSFLSFFPTLRRSFLLTVIVIASIIGALRYIPEDQTMRIQEIPQELSGGTLSNRRIIWETGMNSFYAHPFEGIGIGAFRSISYQHRVSHNAFLSVLVELGLIGFALFILILLSIISALRHLPAMERNMWLISLASWATGVMALTWEYRKVTWLLFAFSVTWVFNTIKKDQKVPNPSSSQPSSPRQN